MAQLIMLSEDTAGMQSLEDAERQSISSGDAVSPEADQPYSIVCLSADPEELELLQNILAELQLVNTDLTKQEARIEEQMTLITEQSSLMQEQTTQIQYGDMAACMFLGFIAGAILVLGLWRGKR